MPTIINLKTPSFNFKLIGSFLLSEIKRIVRQYSQELERNDIHITKIILYGSYRDGNPREESDIDLIVISENFAEMNLRERLEILGLAAGRVFEPIEAIGYTQEEIENSKETFLESILDFPSADYIRS